MNWQTSTKFHLHYHEKNVQTNKGSRAFKANDSNLNENIAGLWFS